MKRKILFRLEAHVTALQRVSSISYNQHNKEVRLSFLAYSLYTIIGFAASRIPDLRGVIVSE